MEEQKINSGEEGAIRSERDCFEQTDARAAVIEGGSSRKDWPNALAGYLSCWKKGVHSASGLRIGQRSSGSKNRRSLQVQLVEGTNEGTNELLADG